MHDIGAVLREAASQNAATPVSFDVSDGYPRRIRTDRLRVTVVVGMFPALSETFVLHQVTSLIDMGHEVRIIADAPRDERAMHEEVAQYGLLQKTHYLSQPPRTRRKRLATLIRAVRGGRTRTARTLDAFRLARKRKGETGEMAQLAAIVNALMEGPQGYRI